MTSTRHFVSLLALALLVASCGTQDQTQDHGLRLNGNERWQMDAHTRDMFHKMSASFEAARSGEVELVKGAGTAMRAEIDDLLVGCTMKGEAHDELHKFLMVYIPAIDKMAADGTKTDANSVRELLDLYPQYFQ